MEELIYSDRISQKKCVEKVYGKNALKYLYGNTLLGRLFSPLALPLIAKYPAVSALYGYLQRTKNSAKKIKPFIADFNIDASEFLKDPTEFGSFNDFFIRELKAAARPIDASHAVIPADARYRFYANIAEQTYFDVKGESLNLAQLVDDPALAARYRTGSMVMARLCPSDYHRFHFPCACTPAQSHLINGWLYSVNPVAIKKNIQIFSQNKRSICQLETKNFGKVLYIEVGATNVGVIQQTYTPNTLMQKGQEKGYFAFGGSALILLFEPGKIEFDADLLELMKEGVEIRCLLGQSLGKAT